ncbi:MAG: hypothetical protein ACAI38_08305 [Myxococcota bacterium]|nr:hypothetical protein [Myxococcota bacterium]
MKTWDVALALREWASEHKLLQTALPETGEEPENLKGPLAIVQQSLGKHVELFERNPITALVVNEARKTVFVYTAKPVPKRKARALPTGLAASAKSAAVTIEFRQAKPQTIGNEEPDAPPALPASAFADGRYTCGSSISIANDRQAGTLGCLVRDAKGQLYGLTNNHVTGGCNNALPGTPILAPGVMDVAPGNYDPFTIGHHHSVLPLHQGEPNVVNAKLNTDVALFTIADKRRVSSMQSSAYDTPAEVVAFGDDMQVEKVGRTTGLTRGVVQGIVVGPVGVVYNVTTYHSASAGTPFVGRAFFEPVYLVHGIGGPFSQPGDSGSLVTALKRDGTRVAVGLVFAGLVPAESYVLPLAPILKRLKVSLVSGHA